MKKYNIFRQINFQLTFSMKWNVRGKSWSIAPINFNSFTLHLGWRRVIREKEILLKEVQNLERFHEAGPTHLNNVRSTKTMNHQKNHSISCQNSFAAREIHFSH